MIFLNKISLDFIFKLSKEKQEKKDGRNRKKEEKAI